MVQIVESNQRRWYLVAETQREIRDFLRAKKLRPTAAGFRPIKIPYPIALALYALSGDELLLAAAWNLPRVTWGALVGFLFIVRRPKYGAAR